MSLQDVITRLRPRMSRKAYEAKLEKNNQNSKGEEVLSDVPMAPPIGYTAQPSMIEHIRSMVTRELSRRADVSGLETAEEADDFDVDDDPELKGPYELDENWRSSPFVSRPAGEKDEPRAPVVDPAPPAGDNPAVLAPVPPAAPPAAK